MRKCSSMVFSHARVSKIMRFTKTGRVVTVLAVFLMAAGMSGVFHSNAEAQSRPEAGQSANPSDKESNAPAGNMQHGKTLFAAVGCYECHDTEGQGGPGAGPKIAPKPIEFDAFVHQLRNPREEMPPYTAKVLSDADVADIYAFLQSIPQPHKADSAPAAK